MAVKILFVCHGNICRSPVAEFVFRDIAKKAGQEADFLIASAATTTDEIAGGVGNPVYPPARETLLRHGIDPVGMIISSAWTRKTSMTCGASVVGIGTINYRCSLIIRIIPGM